MLAKNEVVNNATHLLRYLAARISLNAIRIVIITLVYDLFRGLLHYSDRRLASSLRGLTEGDQTCGQICTGTQEPHFGRRYARAYRIRARQCNQADDIKRMVMQMLAMIRQQSMRRLTWMKRLTCTAMCTPHYGSGSSLGGHG